MAVSKKVTEASLGLVKELNTLSKSGNIYTTEPDKLLKIKPFLATKGVADWEEIEKEYDLFTFNLISTLMNWHQSKFEWEGFKDDATGNAVERLLFMWGKAALINVNNKIYAVNYIPEKLDFYQRPKTIIPVRPDGHKLKKRIVGKDAVLIYNDQSYLWSQRPLIGTLFRVWDHIAKLTLAWKLINRNMNITKQWYTVPFGTDDKHIANLEKLIIKNNKYIIPYSNDVMDQLVRSADGKTLSFDDKTSSTWENFYNLWNELKLFLGIESNANAKKKERQISAEISVQNEIPNSQLEIQSKQRELAVDKINAVFKKRITIKLNERTDDTLNGLNEEPSDSDGDTND